MAKRDAGQPVAMPQTVTDGSHRDYEAHDAFHTLRRAGEIVRDKGLLKRVKKHAIHHARESMEVSRQAEMLAKAGRISEKQMAKLKDRSAA